MAAKRSWKEADFFEPSKRRRSSTEMPTGTDEPEDLHVSQGASKSSHVRFGSEEPEELEQSHTVGDVTLDTTGQEESADDDSVADSDDDAPEAFDTADAQALARAEAAEAAKALQSERAKSRKRRQDRAVQLKVQAETSSKRKIMKANTERAPAEDVSAARTTRRPRVPDLLPDDVLADETIGQRLSPEPYDGNDSKLSKPALRKQVLKFDSKPEDVDVGPVRVSVLEGSSRYMAPKSNKTSRSIKTNWLAGRRGKTPAVERKKPTRGFLVS